MTEENLKLEVKSNERSYVLECSPLSPLGELYDALSQMKNYILNKMVEEQNKENEREEKIKSCCI